MTTPLVTVICTSYNHKYFIEECVNSVLNQTYTNIELILVDNASTDGSVGAIEKIINKNPTIRLIKNDENIGLCRAFNQAFRMSKGEYLIDLAADDVLEPTRIEAGVTSFTQFPDGGISFSDAYYINSRSEIIGPHYKRNKKGELLQHVPQGDVYTEIIARYFICPPTMMYARKVVEALQGYDEQLAYEDFDFQVRASRIFPFVYTDAILVKKRVLENSLSTQQYQPNSKILLSTCAICEKAYHLNRTKQEHQALKKRIYYELRQAILSQNYIAARCFLSLLKKMKDKSVQRVVYSFLVENKINLSFIKSIKP